jgi:protein-S-isoprenylcysteine O-methyltransferase Ste14
MGLCAFFWLGGAILGAWALLAFKRHHTTPEPNGVATALLTSGPFRMSRNPLYLTLISLLTGFGLALDSGWVLLMVPLLALLLDRLVIAREEARLAAQFGEPYRVYLRRVRRWL